MTDVHHPGGKHLIVEFRGCNDGLLNDTGRIETYLRRASHAAQCAILHSYAHPFEPQGVTCFVALAESHISTHTWPEHGYAAIDIFMCGDKDPTLALDYLIDVFGPTDVEVHQLDRR